MAQATTDGTFAAARPAPRLRRRSTRWGEILVKGIMATAALVSVATTVGIVVALLTPAIDFFREISIIDFLAGTRWAPLFEPSSFGVLPLLTGTFVVTMWAMAVALPFGLGAAIYLSEYARPRVRQVLKPALEVLAGIPTVVYGFFALVFFTPLLQSIGIPLQVFNPLSGGIVMGIMIIPTVASVSEDAMHAVPQDLRAGAYGLGASRLQVATRVVVPAAVSGIIAGFVLGISRAIGETGIAVIAIGYIARIDFSSVEAIQTMTAFIASAGQGDVPTGSIEYKTIFAVGLMLFVITLAINISSIRFVRKYREAYE